MSGPRGIGAGTDLRGLSLGVLGESSGIVALLHREHNLQKRPQDIPASRPLEKPRQAAGRWSRSLRRGWSVAIGEERWGA
jgi:hypothetical protein